MTSRLDALPAPPNQQHQSTQGDII